MPIQPRKATNTPAQAAATPLKTAILEDVLGAVLLFAGVFAVLLF